MQFVFPQLIDRYPWLKRAHEVLSFAKRRASDVRMGQVAGSLTFITLLSIVPLFAVALALFTAFPLFAEFRGALENFVLKALPGQISVTVLRYLNEFAMQAARLTAVGLIVLGITALSMIITVDRVLNDIWRVRDRRPLMQRVLIYWAILTLGPILIGASLTASSYLWSLSTEAIMQMPKLARNLLDYAPVIISGFAYAALYVFVPNRTVAWRDALVGGFIAAVLAELLKASFGIFVSRGSARSVYGAFAVLPLFLVWMHLSWYTLLFGAAITATLPRLRSTRFADELRAGNGFLTAVALLKVLFDAKEDPALSGVELARRVRTTPDDAEVLLEKLERLGYVRRLVAARPGRRGGQDWMLTGDPAKVSLRPVFERFAVDPGNTLLTAETLGLGPLVQHWLASDWINAPIADSLSAPAVAQEAVALQGVAFRQVQR